MAAGDLRKMTRTEIAWLAGLIEGEGSFVVIPTKVRLTVAMTDSDIIKRLHNVTNVGHIHPCRTRAKEHYKPVTIWAVSRQRHLYPLVKLIRPWLGQRRGEAADKMLEWIEEKMAP